MNNPLYITIAIATVLAIIVIALDIRKSRKPRTSWAEQHINIDKEQDK